MSNYNSKQGQVQLSLTHQVRVIKQGDNIADVVAMTHRTRQTTRKISATEYVIIEGAEAGEVRQYKQSDDKSNVESLTRTMARLRRLINANFCGSDAELWITLTYRDNMTDTGRLYDDYRKYWQRLQRYCKGRKLGYIAVAEPQERGAWHMHILLKDMSGAGLYISNTDMARIWGLGYTKTRRMESDNVGAYLSAYLCNLPDGSGKGKRYIKGARLKLYPRGMQYYRASRNLRKPITAVMSYGAVLRSYGAPIYRKQVDIEQDGRLVNTIIKEQYNRSRSKRPQGAD